MKDTARNVVQQDAPLDERYDANSELQKAAMPSESDLLPRESMMELAQWAANTYQEQEFAKSLAKPNVIPFPSRNVELKRAGMQSVWLDDRRVSSMGEWYERPTNFGFDTMRMMVDQTPILGAVILTRQRQMQRFARVPENGKGSGFQVRLKDKDAHVSADDKKSILLLQDFFANSGWETKPRERMRLKRDSFPTLLGKLTRDTLIMDSMPIETEFKRDRSLGIDGLYAVDGATIRLCNEIGYKGDDEIFAIQVVDGMIRSAYTFDDLIYVPRNPRTDVLYGGYGMSETELLVKTVTGFLNAFSYNNKYFDSNSIPKGLLHLSGDYDEKDLSAFKRQWNAMVKGINNAWAMPVMVSSQQESKASFEKFGVDVDEMMFSKWMTFLTSIICAIYGISPDEINFESFSSRSGGLGGNDTEEKLASSKDKGLRPLLSYMEDIFSDYVVSEFGDKFVFRFTGLDEEDEKQRWEEEKMMLSVNELRAARGYDKMPETWGDAPLNPSLVGVWQQGQQQGNEDYGNPDDQQQGEDDQQGGEDDQRQAQAGGDGEDGGDGGGKDGKGKMLPPDAPEGEDDDEGADMAKSFGLPIYRVPS